MTSIACIMCVWNEENMIPLALDSTRSMVEKYFICNKPAYDNTKNIIFECKKRWNLNIDYTESEEKLRSARRTLTEKAISEGFTYILIQDGDEIFYNEGPTNIKNIVKMLGTYNGIDSKMICLYKRLDETIPEDNNKLKWHGYSNNSIELVPHPTFFRSKAYTGYPNTKGDMPSYKDPKLIYHWPFKFDCKVKTPIRMFLRRHFTAWHDGNTNETIEEYTLRCDEYTKKFLINHPNATLYDIAESYYNTIKSVKYDRERYFPYPSVIQKYINNGYVFGYKDKLL